MFLNSLVLRLELDPDPSGPGKADEAPTFRQVLRRAREAALGAYTHQDVPFEMLLEALEVDRELSRTPLFQVFLNVASFPQDRVPLEGLEVEVVQTDAHVGSKFDLTLYASPAGPGGPAGQSLRMNLVYDSGAADLAPRARGGG
jgi:non-ribosomal peptide synthetase component F